MSGYSATTSYLYVRDITASNDPYADTDLFCSEILKQDIWICGVDTEKTVPTAQTRFRQQLISKPSIIQICIKGKIGYVDNIQTKYPIRANSDYTCYIFPLKMIFLQHKRLPTNLTQILKLDTIIKVGASIRTDVREIEREFGTIVAGWIDLQDIARSFGERKVALDDLAYLYLNSKKEPSGGGDYDKKLSPEQIKYAAIDAYLSLAVYNAMFDRRGVPMNKSTQLENRPATLSDTDFLTMFNFLRNETHIFDKKNPIEFTKFLSTFRNSYKSWKNEYSVPVIESFVQKFLDRMVQLRYLLFDNITETYRLPSSTVTQESVAQESPVLTEEQLADLREKTRAILDKQVTMYGIPRNSLIKTLITIFKRVFPEGTSSEYITTTLAGIINSFTAESPDTATPNQFLIREPGGERRYYKIQKQ